MGPGTPDREPHQEPASGTALEEGVLSLPKYT